MADTLNRDYPYPGGSEAPNGPYSFQALADAVDADVQSIDVRLTAAEQVVCVRFERTIVAPGGVGFSNFTAADTKLIEGTITGLRAGVYRVEGFGPLKSGGGANGATFVKAGAVTAYERCDLDPFYRSPRATLPKYVHAGGDLTISFGYDVAAGTATIADPGTKQPCSVILTQIGSAAVSA